MGDLVNLRKARLEKAKAAKGARSAENRIVHGETKATRVLREANHRIERERHEAGRLEPSSPRKD
jgi:hypothetical protein